MGWRYLLRGWPESVMRPRVARVDKGALVCNQLNLQLT